MENHRLFDFQGSDTEYIKFLESKLMSIECQLCLQQSTLPSSSARCENNATALCLSPTSSTHPASTSSIGDAPFRPSIPNPYSLFPQKRTSSGHIRSPGDNDGPLSPSQSSTASSCRRNETHSNHPTNTRGNEATQCLQSLCSNSTSDVQNNSTAQACEIVFYNPTLGCPPKKKQKLPDAVSKWKTDANKLLASVTTTDKWNERKKETGFNDVANNRVAIHILLGAPSEDTPIMEKDGAKGDPPVLPTLNPTDHKTMISDACRYGRFSIETELNATFSSLVSNYQKLIFINYCIVLLYTGNSTETIDWMMRRYISDSSSKNLKQYRRGCAQSPHLYARLAEAPVECHKMFTERLGAAEVPQCEDGFIPFCIPSIIKYLIGDKIE
ncbi:hypothetical protein AJ78_03688 [Emergomyces pasteurianus Ep9510]|uniref:Uncharacterized protein n=1 Tax=Emergomyces pasteurianus Ep9510 TaxID=1447872 RepID=A0A1J9QJN2_9EURO|nr:hypothetical protein AJ78_03688 [Emergomyces pasteurianus Ep9510]